MHESTASAPLSAGTMDGLMTRTKALLDHQMRTNLAFAEAVAAEYGRELSVRLSAQRREFASEQNRRHQMMEISLRRRVAEIEDSYHRQFEERQMTSYTGSQPGYQDGGLSSAGSSRDPSNSPPVLQKRVTDLVRELVILRSELEVQKDANRQLQQELIRDRENAHAVLAESGATAKALAQAFNDERGYRMMLESKSTGGEQRANETDNNQLGSPWSGKTEILHLEKGMMWAGQSAEGNAHIEKISYILADLQKYMGKLEQMLVGGASPEIPGVYDNELLQRDGQQLFSLSSSAENSTSSMWQAMSATSIPFAPTTTGSFVASGTDYDHGVVQQMMYASGLELHSQQTSAAIEDDRMASEAATVNEGGGGNATAEKDGSDVGKMGKEKPAAS
ncbi:hypothetical protein HKX48_001091 [Thoreauomyces humboldtii]|nr:hypothetical protein HKX48_001091 [Thoreauomyces humboldtii]